jgi:hypothetical protein
METAIIAGVGPERRSAGARISPKGIHVVHVIVDG